MNYNGLVQLFQIPHICKRDRRISKVIGLLQNIVETEHRIIIFSSSKDDIRFIVEVSSFYSTWWTF